jgi:hypothetical protein
MLTDNVFALQSIRAAAEDYPQWRTDMLMYRNENKTWQRW